MSRSSLLGERDPVPTLALCFRLDSAARITWADAPFYPRIKAAIAENPLTAFAQLLYHGDRSTLADLIARLTPDAPTAHFEARLRFCEGLPNWFRISVQGFHEPERNDLIGLALHLVPCGNHDERFLRELAAGVQQSADGFAITDLDGTILYVNPAFSMITGYTPEEAIGATMRIVKSAVHSKEFYQDLWRTISTGGVWRGRITNRRKNGEFYEEYQTISPVRDARGRIARFVAVKRDVSAETRFERELAQKRRVEAVGRLAGGIAHDFNNILTAILGASFMVRDSVMEGDAAISEVLEQLDQLDASANLAADLTRKLLTFSRQDCGETRVFDLGRVLSQTKGILTHLLKGNVVFSLELPEEAVHVLGDEPQVKQIILNLAVNAQEAMPQGGRLVIALERSEPSDRQGRRALLRIRDEGVGMEPEVKERIFDPFFSTKPLHEGAGLGLANVHGIVTEMGGKIEVESSPNQGCEFRIYFPLAIGGS